ncbi:MAG: SIS domain-containing protein, partial [Erysipelotrichaceae bacterium]|nr:SIS domain-containing protein [Erysipelotrichaceae bacterium]
MYESIMWKYMGEEKTLLNALITNETEKEKIHKIDRMKALYCVAHGSSYNAAMSIAPFMTELSGVRTYVYTPSNFRFNALSIKEEDKEDTWVLGISQTGTSRGVLEALEQAKNDGFRILGITNVEGSPIDKLSDVCLYLHCGEEDSNAKTKGYSSTLVLLMMLGIEMGKDVDKDEYYAQLKEEIDHLDDVRN